jgi:hypothetical protein
MRLLSLTLTILILTTTSAVAAPASTCEGRYCTVHPEPWSGVRKNVSGAQEAVKMGVVYDWLVLVTAQEG